jgi:fumarate reductase flavoprotein subunit
MKVDVVAFGAGFAGMVAACRAAQAGLRVAVLEKETGERYVCSSRWSTGVFATMGQPTLSSPEHLAGAIMKGTDGTARPELANAIGANARRAYEWLMTEGGRFINHATHSGQQLVLAPPRRRSEGLDWEGRGADTLLRKLEENLVSRGGQLLRGTRVESLAMENGACVGVKAVQEGGPVRFDAKAVIIADGGFQANPDMVRRYITKRPERVLLRAAPGGRGDGIRMAEAAGAAIGGFGKFYGHVHHRDAMTNNRLWPYPHFDAMAEFSLIIGADGRRFTDEGLGGVCMTNAIAQLEDPLSATIVFDDAMWTGEPGKAPPTAANPFLLSGGGWMHSAPDLDALAQKAGLPAAAMAETVRDYNEAVKNGRLGELKPSRSLKQHKPMPIAVPPFHAVPLCAGLTLGMGGIDINENAQALRPDGSPIPGLYVAGTPVSGLEGGPRAGYVGGLCKAFTLGLIAGEHIAGGR